jgi:tetratricopeptide (TPR) repeat protein
VATSLNNLALVYIDLKQYDVAELLYKRALIIAQDSLGPEHPDVAQYLNGLAFFYEQRAEYDLAEPLYSKAIDLQRRVLGPDHPNLANSLNNLAMLYDAEGKYEQALESAQKALERLTKPHFSSNSCNVLKHPYGQESSNGHRTLA